MSNKKKKTKFPNRKDDKYFPDQEKAPSPDEGHRGEKDSLDKVKDVAHKLADKMIEAKAAGVPTPTVAPAAVAPAAVAPAAVTPPAMPVAPRQMPPAPRPMPPQGMPTMKKGGSVKAAASRIKSSASRRADGAAQRGKTKGRTL
jgi:hypothetical protein